MGRWTLRWGAPSAAVALVSVWALEPTGLAGMVIVVGVAPTALVVSVAMMPRRQRARRGAGE